MEKFLTAKEAADLLKVGTQTIKRWIEAGRIESVKIGRFHRISEESIQKAIRANTLKKGRK